MDFSRGEYNFAIRSIFKRCVDCDPDAELPCPTCPDNQVCSLQQQTCDQCARKTCVDLASVAGSSSDTSSSDGDGGSDGPNIGAIAGGVVGGVVFIAIISFLIWKFCMKGKRQNYQYQEDVITEKGPDDFTLNAEARASRHTVASFASTVMTRASNIIQIAYIPGVTNRNTAQSPGLLVPPVPPIPAMASPSTQPSSPFSLEDEHFFVPGDLRGSTYSAATSADGRSSFARTSIAPSLARSSVATTIYRQNAVVPAVPAQTIMRGKAAVVSVKSSTNGSPTDTPNPDTPPVPQVDFSKFEKATAVKSPVQIRMPQSSDSPLGRSPAGSVRSTATIGKPTPLNITKKNKSPAGVTATVAALASGVAASTAKAISAKPSITTIGNLNSPATMTTVSEVDDATLVNTSPNPANRASKETDAPTDKSVMEPDSDSEDEQDPHERSRRSLLRPAGRESNITEIMDDTPAVAASPFGDLASRAAERESIGVTLMPVDEERGREDTKATETERETSPFGDENEVKDSR